MLNQEKLNTALNVVLTACAELGTPSVKYAKQFEGVEKVLLTTPKAFSCFGVDCSWQQKAC
jgi:hypothetical protein